MTRLRYIEATLPENETIEIVIKFHWVHKIYGWGLSLFWVFLSLLVYWTFQDADPPNIRNAVCLILISIGIVPFVSFWIERYSTERVVSSNRIIIKRGLIRRITEEIRLDKIEEVNLIQTIFNRIIGTATLNINGTGGNKLSMKWIANPLDVQKMINSKRI